MTILDAVRDPLLFGSLFQDLGTWRAHLVKLKAIYGEPMDAAELLYRKHTGGAPRRPHPRGRWSK